MITITPRARFMVAVGLLLIPDVARTQAAEPLDPFALPSTQVMLCMTRPPLPMDSAVGAAAVYEFVDAASLTARRISAAVDSAGRPVYFGGYALLEGELPWTEHRFFFQFGQGDTPASGRITLFEYTPADLDPPPVSERDATEAELAAAVHLTAWLRENACGAVPDQRRLLPL